jgi:hypothetical protein
VQFYDLKNGAKIRIKIEKEGKWGNRKVRPFLTFTVELHLRAKK